MDLIEKVWPQWKTVELIGKGSFGKVYKVKREDFGNTFYSAVKIIEIPQDESEVKELAASGMDAMSIRTYFEAQVSDLVNEIKIMESLKSASTIVAIEDYYIEEHEDSIGWTLYIRMELLKSLNQYIADKNTLDTVEIVRLGIDISEALVCCEQTGVIHRDIKPDNIFRNPYGCYKLGDFGVAKQLERTRGAMSQKGTNMYMAPEVFRVQKYNHTVDIYSLGITLYRLLNGGRFPFVPENPLPKDIDMAMQKRLGGSEMPAPRDADEGLAAIILKCCAYQMEARYQSAAEVRRDLTEWLRGRAQESGHAGNSGYTGQMQGAETEQSVKSETGYQNMQSETEKTWCAFEKPKKETSRETQKETQREGTDSQKKKTQGNQSTEQQNRGCNTQQNIGRNTHQNTQTTNTGASSKGSVTGRFVVNVESIYLLLMAVIAAISTFAGQLYDVGRGVGNTAAGWLFIIMIEALIFTGLYQIFVKGKRSGRVFLVIGCFLGMFILAITIDSMRLSQILISHGELAEMIAYLLMFASVAIPMVTNSYLRKTEGGI